MIFRIPKPFVHRKIFYVNPFRSRVIMNVLSMKVPGRWRNVLPLIFLSLCFLRLHVILRNANRLTSKFLVLKLVHTLINTVFYLISLFLKMVKLLVLVAAILRGGRIHLVLATQARLQKNVI